MQPPAIGIDFGTTNSSIALVTPGGEVRLASFPTRLSPTRLGPTPSYRSVLYLEQIRQESGSRKTFSYTGPSAINHYLDAEDKGRLIQSLKSNLSSRSLTGTGIFNRRYSFEQLVSRILSDLREQAEQQFAVPIRRATVGRPVRFVGADTPEDDAFALSRLRSAFTLAGFDSIDFQLEPIAAGFAYQSTLDHDELLLIGDFGGGTSDFSLLRVGPTTHSRALLGNSGVGIAGDAFDARIVRKLVSPALGSNSYARSLNDLLLAVPAWVYAKLEHWHHLSFLRTHEVTELLRSARLRALEPEKIKALTTLIEEDLGYQLHQSVQRVKFELSHADTAVFHFHDGSMELDIPVTRLEFESWIADELHRIERCIDDLLTTANILPAQVDRVFLTGGSSFVPAVRRIFSNRFGEDRIRSGNEFTSVAHGLALSATQSPRP